MDMIWQMVAVSRSPLTLIQRTCEYTTAITTPLCPPHPAITTPLNMFLDLYVSTCFFACHMHVMVVLTIIMFLCCRLQSVDDVAMVTPMCGGCKSDEVTTLPPRVDSVVSTSPPSSGAIIPVSVVTALFILLCAILVVALVIMVILFLRARNLEGGVSLNSKVDAVESGNQTEKYTGKQNGDQTGKQNGDQTGKQTGYQGDNYYDEIPEKDDHVYTNNSAQESV